MKTSDLDSLARLNWWRGFLACAAVVAIGVGAGCAFALGFAFQLTGGWR